MERIERALEIARLHRHRVAEQPFDSEPAPSFVEPELAAHPGLRLDEALTAELPSRNALREHYIIFPDEPGPASLAYKMLRTQVLQRSRQHSMRCIGIVSGASGEGKTITAINLALSLAAEPNQSVVLVDLDLKRPGVATKLALEVDKGIESWFGGSIPLETLWRRYASIERFVVMPAAMPLPNSSDLLAGPQGADLFKRLREVEGEPLILVDLPPALLSDDVLAVAPLLDGVVLVVTEELTRREDIQRVFELLRSTPVIGTVLNGSAEAEARAY